MGGWVCGWVGVVCIRSSLHSVRFGQLLRCAHKRIVNRKEQLIFTFTFAKRGIQRDSHVYAWIVVTTYACSIVITLIIRDTSSLFCAQSMRGKSISYVHVR